MEKYISKIEKEFDEKFKCIQSDCDGNGNIPKLVCGMVQISDTECEQTQEWEAEQCQFHAEYLFPIKSFLKQSFIKYLQSEVERLSKHEKVCLDECQIDTTGDCNCGMWAYNQAVSDQITHINQQLKELEV